MQLVNAIDIPIVNHHPVDRKVRAVCNELRREVAGIWRRILAVLAEYAGQRPLAAPQAIGLPGYYGAAYQRLSAAMPIMSCSDVVGATPFRPASASRPVTAAARTGGPRTQDDVWLAIQRADPAIPARMM